MNAREVREKLVEILKEKMKIENVDESLQGNLFGSLEIDSLMALELLVSIEQEFEIEIDDEDLNADLLSSEEKLVEYILNKRAE